MNREAPLRAQIPRGYYQVFAGYGGGGFEDNSVVSNPVSSDLEQQGLDSTN
ncbi:MAG TPA: hypothetical protein VK579_14840 [Terriglobales bacterium]|nr:hypothetical protein [Terriglobales bacterium]